MDRQKGFTPILILVIIALLIVGGYLVYKSKQTVQSTSTSAVHPASGTYAKDLKAGLEKAFK